MPDPLTIGALAQGAIGLGKSIFGATQAAKARRRLRQLEKERPKGYIPSAILERAAEPIAEEFMEAQEQGAQRRTSQAIGALSQGGSRALLAGLPQIVDQERLGEVQRTGRYEQARQDALGVKGAAQERIRQEARQDFLRKVAAEQNAMGAGTQNIFTGLEDLGEAGLYYGYGGGFDSTPKDSNSGEYFTFDEPEYIMQAGRMVKNPLYVKPIS